MKRGCPPTDRNARTGLLTPPGINCCACAKSLADRRVFITGAHPTMLQEKGSRKSKGRTGREDERLSEVKKCQIRFTSILFDAGKWIRKNRRLCNYWKLLRSYYPQVAARLLRNHQ